MAEVAGEKLHVLFTMDCLPAGGKGEVQGPAGWDDAVGAVNAFADALAEEGCRGTFFLAPEALGRFRETAERLLSDGCELGLLCHPQLGEHQECLGAYNYDRQREILRVARGLWEDELGDAPVTFRPGFFSANDHTYHALCMEGFRQGSCSLPGRTDSERCSMWLGGYPFAHHTDPLDRMAKGTMEFFEVPVTSDHGAASYGGHEASTPPHLRIEAPDLPDYARGLMLRLLKEMAGQRVLVRTITFVTSNLAAWAAGGNAHRERLRSLCALVREIAGQSGLELCWSIPAEAHEAADAVLRVETDVVETDGA